LARKASRVADLAEEAGLETDEALILLWDAGLDRFETGSAIIRRSEFDTARHAVGLDSVAQYRHRSYWQGVLGLDVDSMDQLLARLDIYPGPLARRLPKGAIKKLRRWAKREGRLPEPQPAPAAVVAERPRVATPYRWRRIGRHPRKPTLVAGDLERIHTQLVEDFRSDEDPIEPPGVRSRDLLASAAFRPETANGNEYKYSTAEMAAAALLHSIVHDHPFYNGNKRTALVALLVQLDQSNLVLTCSEYDLFRFILRVAQHRVVDPGRNLADREVAWVATWICDNSREIDRTERPLQWRKLRRLLADFDCAIHPAAGVGNRLNISRTIRAGSGFLGRPKLRTLRTQVQSSGDGSDADRSTIKKIRTDLELDDDHDIDSLVFYRAAEEQIARGFIAKYRKTLKRLAHL
jgi:death-on-curing family protein